jgi:hypothetical protein
VDCKKRQRGGFLRTYRDWKALESCTCLSLQQTHASRELCRAFLVGDNLFEAVCAWMWEVIVFLSLQFTGLYLPWR